jgi:hypothetical protein
MLTERIPEPQEGRGHRGRVGENGWCTIGENDRRAMGESDWCSVTRELTACVHTLRHSWGRPFGRLVSASSDATYEQA